MKKIIWIIDDDEAFRFLSLHSIGQAQIDLNDVREYESALEALEYLRSNAHLPENLPDVIMLDINMPRMDGWQFLEDLTGFHSNLLKRIFIFIVSTTDDEKEVNRARNHAYVTDFLSKPFSTEKFMEIMLSVF